jgi:hypothetical protein
MAGFSAMACARLLSSIRFLPPPLFRARAAPRAFTSLFAPEGYSHSIVAGGLLEMS